MALTYFYPDQYLSRLVTEPCEQRAMQYIAEKFEAGGQNPLPPFWRQRLVVLRTYILTCQECQAEADDLFAQKGATYQAELDREVPSALAARDAAGTNATKPRPGASFFTVPLERA